MVDLSTSRVGLTARRAPRSARARSEQALGRFVRTEHWNGLVSGDVVKVSGHPARGRHWRFRAHVTNTSNGASWVEVALVEGPPPSRRVETASEARVERIRSFAPDLVSARWRKGRRAASATAPEGGQSALF